MANVEDAELVKKYLAGDQDALKRLYEAYIPAVFNFLNRMVPVGLDIENLAQETFVKAWSNLKRYDTDKPFKTWLFTIAKNTLFDELKKKRNVNFSDLQKDDGEGELDVADDRPLPDELLKAAEADDRIGELLGRLKPKQATVVVLHVLEGMTFVEIGEVMGEPMDTVKTRYRRTLAILEKMLLEEADYRAKYTEVL